MVRRHRVNDIFKFLCIKDFWMQPQEHEESPAFLKGEVYEAVRRTSDIWKFLSDAHGDKHMMSIEEQFVDDPMHSYILSDHLQEITNE